MLQTRETANAGGDRSLHALKFAGSEVGVGPLMQAREKLGPEAGTLWRLQVPALDRRQRRDELFVPAGVVRPDRLLHQSVGKVDGEVGRGGGYYRPSAAAGRDGGAAR